MPTTKSPGSKQETNAPVLEWVNPLEISDWDELLLTHPDATVFHSAGWAATLAETYGYLPRYLIARDGDYLLALLPLMEINSRLTGRRGVSLPFTDVCSVLDTRCVAFNQLWLKALQLANDRHWKYIEIRGGGLAPEHSHATYFEHTLNLISPAETLLSNMDPAMRRAIRKAGEAGIKIESFSDLDSVRLYYQLHRKTRQKHGIPPQSFAFFKNIYSNLIQRNNGRVTLAFLSGMPVAGAIFFQFGKKALYKFGASNPEYLGYRPNNLLFWRAINMLKSSACEELSFGRTGLRQAGLRRFKLGLGASERIVKYWRFNISQEQFSPEATEKYGQASRLFRFCPQFVARLAGKIAYPHLG
jgi:hypothetical protein